MFQIFFFFCKIGYGDFSYSMAFFEFSQNIAKNFLILLNYRVQLGDVKQRFIVDILLSQSRLKLDLCRFCSTAAQ